MDFAVPDYREVIEDQSGNGNDFYIAGDTSIDPFYVHNQGLFFDGSTNTFSKAISL